MILKSNLMIDGTNQLFYPEIYNKKSNFANIQKVLQEENINMKKYVKSKVNTLQKEGDI